MLHNWVICAGQIFSYRSMWDLFVPYVFRQYGRPCNCERLTGKSSGYYSSTSLPGYQIYDIPYEDQENNNTFEIDKNIIGLAFPNTLENEKREESEEELGEQLDINRLSNEVPNLDEESSHDWQIDGKWYQVAQGTSPFLFSQKNLGQHVCYVMQLVCNSETIIHFSW